MNGVPSTYDSRMLQRRSLSPGCPTRNQLLNAYAETTRAHAHALEELCALAGAGLDGPFRSMAKVAERAAARCATARKEFETHQRDHRC